MATIGVGMNGESVDLDGFYEVRGAFGETLAYIRDTVDALRTLRTDFIEGAATVWRVSDGVLLSVHPLRGAGSSSFPPPPVSRTVSTLPPPPVLPSPLEPEYEDDLAVLVIEPEKQSA